MLIAFLICVAVFFIAFFTLDNNTKERVIYKDTGPKARIFVNKKYNIAAKPDLILKKPEGYIGFEYKGRKRGIYESDIIEAKAAALAARSKYPIYAIQIKNQTQNKVIVLPKSNADLYKEIERYVLLTSQAQSKQLPATPHPMKCRVCPVKTSCSYRLN
ncbi:hypothetical protein ACV4QK_20620 (plasmid) [Alteromonas macleodii]